MAHLKRVRIIKKIRVDSGIWKFVSLQRNGSRYIWDEREGTYFVEWWEGPSRRREVAGVTPSDAREAQRRKQHELVGQSVAGGKVVKVESEDHPATSLEKAREAFLAHVKVHSPDKPKTLGIPVKLNAYSEGKPNGIPG